MILDLKTRLEYASTSYKLVEVGFKYVNWLLTIGAVKFLARVTHSRGLDGASGLMLLFITYPALAFFNDPRVRFKSGWRLWVQISCEIAGTLFILLFVNQRLSRIVDAIVAQHIGGAS